MRIQRIIVAILLCLIMIVGIQNPVVQSDSIAPFEQKRVLFISAYSPSFPTFFNQVDGIQDTFEGMPIVLDIEFMDSKRFYTPTNLTQFEESISYKLSQIEYDLVMTSDDNAIDFVMDHRDDLFIDLPIVFFGTNNEVKANEYANEDSVTGVVEAVSMKETIELALMIQPNVDNIVALVDNTNTGQSELESFYEYENQFPDIAFTDINLGEMSLIEFSSQIAILDNNTIVLLIAALRDEDDTPYEFNETLQVILNHSNVPVYHLYEFGIEDGLIGGKVVSHYVQGQTASEIVLRIFEGEDINDIPLVDTSPNVYVINYEVFEKYGFNESALPEETVFVNRDYTLFEEYGLYFVLAFLFVVAQTAIIVKLIISVRHQKQAESEVIETNQQLEQLNDQLYYKSYHDDLTGLYNRNYFEEQYPRLLDMGEDITLSIVLVDVNGLKLINDAFGHITGDKVLIEVSKVMLDIFEDSDVFRIGGDEFAILPYGKDEQTISELIKQLNDKIHQIIIEGINISVSIGFALYDGQNSLDEMFTEAEDWMYREKLNHVPSNRSATIEAIIATINQKDLYSEEHSKRVSKLAVKIAEHMDVGDNMISEIKTAGLLHDIGKIIVPTHILNKEGRLTSDEFNEIKKHSEIGYRILNSVASMRNISEYVFCHHERMDGLGYPRGLKGNQIPMQSRIIAIADAMDAMLTDRKYRNKLTNEECYKELQKHQGTQFCIKAIDIVLENFEDIVSVINEV